MRNGRTRVLSFKAAILILLCLLLQSMVFAVDTPDTPPSGLSWSLWNDDHGTVWAARAIPVSIGKFKSGTVEPYWTFSGPPSASPITQPELTQLQYRRTRSFEWIIPHHGVIQFRKIGAQKPWRNLLTASGGRIVIDHVALIDANPSGLIVEQSSDGRHPLLLSIREPRRGEPESREYFMFPSTHSSMTSDNGLTDGTGGHGVLLFDKGMNLLSITPGDKEPRMVSSSAEIHELFQHRKQETIVNGIHSRLDSEAPEILGRTNAGILLRQIVFDDLNENFSKIMCYRVGSGGKILPLPLEGSIINYACDGFALWAVIDNNRALGTRDFKADSASTFNLVRMGDGPAHSVRLPILGNYRHFQTLLVKLPKHAVEAFVVSAIVNGNSTSACRIRCLGDGTMICSPPASVPGIPSKQVWCGAISNNNILLPMADGTVSTLFLQYSRKQL